MFEIAVVVLLAGACLWAVAAPLMRPPAEFALEQRENTATEAAKESKYREIRDAEADYRAGKLTQQEWQEVDADLRAEAIEILDNGPNSDIARD